VKISGDDLDTLRSLGGQAEQLLAGTPGLVDLRLERQVRAPEIHVRVDEDAARFHGITPARIAGRIDLLSGGERVAEVVDGSRRFGVTIQLPEAARTREGLAAVLIETPRGAVPLGSLATVEESDGPNQVQREDGRRRIVVSSAAGGGASGWAVRGPGCVRAVAIGSAHAMLMACPTKKRHLRRPPRKPLPKAGRRRCRRSCRRKLAVRRAPSRRGMATGSTRAA